MGTGAAEPAPYRRDLPAPSACTIAWNDGRIELLKILHGGGFSASQIAKQLGGVTRSAVIGKLYRLGLSAPAKPSKPGARVPKVETRRQAKAFGTSNVKPLVVKAPVMKCEPIPEGDDAPGTCADLMELGSYMCKWPIGDPREEGFSFCGRGAPDGPYCPEHHKRAYHPPNTTESELQRSVRRYA